MPGVLNLSCAIRLAPFTVAHTLDTDAPGGPSVLGCCLQVMSILREFLYMLLPSMPFLKSALLVLACVLSLPQARAQGTAAGEVEFSRGVGFAQQPGKNPRTLGKGLPLQEGDRVTTADGSSAVVRLKDGTRMTVRPNSELVLQQYQFKEAAPDNSFVMQLVRGGFRAVTGLIAKSSPNAARVQTSTATIGIRGTDFDARVCVKDCNSEANQVLDKARPAAVQASAKVLSIQGEVSAVDGSGQRRRLANGGSVYAGDLVETGAGTKAMLAFRDESRVALGSTTRFKVDNFVYDDKNPGEGRFLSTLLKGSIRALTGLIGKSNHRNVNYNTATATIGIRGSEGLITCEGVCAGEPSSEPGSGLTVFTFLGALTVTPNPVPGQAAGAPQSAMQVLLAGQGVFIGRDGTVRPVPAAPPANLGAPLPPSDTVVDQKQLFGTAPVSEADEGLFVFVRDGHIEIATPKEVIHLGKGETGYASGAGDTARPSLVPRFIDFDKLPLPTSKNPLLVSILGESGIKKSAKQCK
jgi:hypothetical protein